MVSDSLHRVNDWSVLAFTLFDSSTILTTNLNDRKGWLFTVGSLADAVGNSATGLLKHPRCVDVTEVERPSVRDVSTS